MVTLLTGCVILWIIRTLDRIPPLAPDLEDPHRRAQQADRPVHQPTRISSPTSRRRPAQRFLDRRRFRRLAIAPDQCARSGGSCGRCRSGAVLDGRRDRLLYVSREAHSKKSSPPLSPFGVVIMALGLGFSSPLVLAFLRSRALRTAERSGRRAGEPGADVTYLDARRLTADGEATEMDVRWEWTRMRSGLLRSHRRSALGYLAHITRDP